MSLPQTVMLWFIWSALMGLGQFIYDYQTLIAGAAALGAAYVKRKAEAIRAEHQAILDAIDARGGRPYPPAEPRVRRL